MVVRRRSAEVQVERSVAICFLLRAKGAMVLDVYILCKRRGLHRMLLLTGGCCCRLLQLLQLFAAVGSSSSTGSEGEP